jgi:hypothetical protein
MLVTSTIAPARKSRTTVSMDDQASGGVIAPLPEIEVRCRDVPVHVQLWAIEGTAHAWWPSHFIPSLSLSDPAPLNAHTGLAEKPHNFTFLLTLHSPTRHFLCGSTLIAHAKSQEGLKGGNGFLHVRGVLPGVGSKTIVDHTRLVNLQACGEGRSGASRR